VQRQQGFVLTRHWHDTPEGTCVEFWLATDQGPRHLRLAPQPSVAFIPAQAEHARVLLAGEQGSSSSRCNCATSTSARCWACTAASTVS
jgi:DNA polymerase-2